MPTTSNFYAGDTISHDRWTLDVGLRFDRQDGEALPSETLANAAFPTVVPGFVFAGYETPFTWNNWSPRAGLTYALDESRKTVAAGELSAAPPDSSTPARSASATRRSTAGSVHLSLGRPERRPLRAGRRGQPQ